MRGVLSQRTLATAIAELPSCALLCLETAIEKSTCSATNETCVCTNKPLQTQVTLCVTESCTIIEGLTTKNITETTCGASVRDKGGLFNAVSNTFASIAGAAVTLKVVSKLVTRAEFGADDYSVFATFALGIATSVLAVHGLTSNGLGRDIWTLAPRHISNYLRFFYIMEVVYFAQVSLLKLSILLFYLRIFPAPPFRRLLWATVIFDILFGTVFILGGIFQCHPISYYWNQWDGLHKGKCLNINGLGWANAIISILLDVWMLGLAISQLIHLQLHWKKKVGVGMMFAVGTFVTVVSILRLQSLVQFANSMNPTWHNLPVTVWSIVEINVGVICACMPNLRVLLVRIFPKILGTTRNASANKYNAQGSHSRIGANVSVGRSKDLPTPPINNKTIMYSRSYDVDLGDETHLVHMNDLLAGYGRSRSHGSSIGE
ncbi:hypothetical protein DL95DRAFT_452399 [Leptodontidium sp. 2 PMI_412]|nr:hypothetical protein DL95DRAFT_452399 [Leptodontidium sp. 2 PMI_412]